MSAESSTAADRIAEVLRRHLQCRGKVQMLPKCDVRGLEDFAVWYSPGVAEPCKAIARDPTSVNAYTNRGNTIAVVSDGSRVLGLGDIGPHAALPVMEGKALLFKYLGGVDAVPLCVATKSADELVQWVRALEPSFGGINLEDIAQPKCFAVLDALRASLAIPVWHDDQQGTAVVVLAALTNALAVVGKSMTDARIVLLGAGAANVAIYRMLTAAGAAAGNIIVCDSRGTLHRARGDIEQQASRFPDKWRMCSESNAARVGGGVADALRGADACIAFSQSRPGTIEPAWIRAMARDPIVFACANPEPEIWPADAIAAGARIVATGRSDFPNQVNNALCFPAVFRGMLDVCARTITDGMALAAARELAQYAADTGLDAERIVPRLDEPAFAPRVAAAVGMQAQRDGVASVALDRDALIARAQQVIGQARASIDALMQAGQLPVCLPEPHASRPTVIDAAESR